MFYILFAVYYPKFVLLVNESETAVFISARESMKVKSEKVKMPPRKFSRVPERPEWEGKRVTMVHVRDLSQVNDDDVWAEMVKGTSQNHQSGVMIRQEVTVELTDVSTQAKLTPGNALMDIGFTSGGGGSRGRRVTPKKAPAPLRKASPVVGPKLWRLLDPHVPWQRRS